MRLKIGEKYTCTAIEIKSYGVIMEFSDKSRQLLHISNITDQFVKNIEDFITIGEQYEVTAIPGIKHPVEITMRDRSDRIEAFENSNDFEMLLEYYLPTDRDKLYKHDNSRLNR